MFQTTNQIHNLISSLKSFHGTYWKRSQKFRADILPSFSYVKSLAPYVWCHFANCLCRLPWGNSTVFDIENCHSVRWSTHLPSQMGVFHGYVRLSEGRSPLITMKPPFITIKPPFVTILDIIHAQARHVAACHKPTRSKDISESVMLKQLWQFTTHTNTPTHTYR